LNGKYSAKKHRRDLLRRVSGQESACGGKQSYAEEAEAEAAIRRMQAEPNFRDRPGFKLTAYQCVCKQWHTGNKPVAIPRVRGGRRKSA
jgi:hypothetical protein